MEWGLRDYGSDTVRVWGGSPSCEHAWSDSLPFTGNKRGNKPGEYSTSSLTNPERQDTLPRPKISGKFCGKCGAWCGSLGLEPHPQFYIDHLVGIFREVKRVLKPTGTFWLNLGDTYYGSGGKGGQYEKFMPDKGQPDHYRQNSKARSNWLQPKQKLMIPSRVAIALQDDGWILRSDIIWHKPNHMPSSVQDRLTTAYEHIFLFVKARRYYFDLDAIRKPHQGLASGNKERTYLPDPRQNGREHVGRSFPWEPTVKGKNPGDVWKIATTPFPGAHFATFPPKLIEPIIKAGSPRQICSRCKKPRTRITEPTPEYAEKLGKSVNDHKDDLKRGMRYDTVTNAEYITTGWTDCGCGAPWTPGIVLDPFGGSGTVGQVARKLGRRFILIEINPEYIKIAEQRVRGKYRAPSPGATTLI